VVEAEQVQLLGLLIVDVHAILHGAVADLSGRAIA
jgi:hypothetical protein